MHFCREVAEYAALDQAASFYVHIRDMHRTMSIIAAFFSVVILLLKLCITSVAVIVQFITTSTSLNDPSVVYGLKVFNTCLPVVLGIFLTVNESYEPVSKTATLKYAKVGTCGQICFARLPAR